jgi:hypothetical protein
MARQRASNALRYDAIGVVVSGADFPGPRHAGVPIVWRAQRDRQQLQARCIIYDGQ